MGYKTGQNHTCLPCLPVAALTFLLGVVIGAIVIEGLGATDEPALDSEHPCVIALGHSDDIITSSNEAMRISRAALQQHQSGDVDGLLAGADRLRELGTEVAGTAPLYDDNYAICMEEFE